MNRSESGFTLVEVITVILLIAVVGAVAIMSGTSGNTDTSARSDQLKTHLRYAQSRAMNSDMGWGVQFVGTAYTLYRLDGAGVKTSVAFPGESGTTVSLPVSITGIVQFDSWGRPSGLSTLILGASTITITPDTGFIP
jgi:MSHA pilin protein MshC